MIIDEKKIELVAENTFEPIRREVELILGKAASARGLTLEEAALLLSIEDAELTEELFKKAAAVKQKVFGKRVVLFAPLYLSNYCTNGCVYCGFRSSNKDVARKALTTDEVVREARALVEMGFNRVLLVTGEDPRWGLEYIISCVRAVYEQTGMRIVHVNAPPMDAELLEELKSSGVGVYQSFQETYHRPTYEMMHPSGAKRDYDYRLDVMDRALTAGFEDVGIGPLYGLYDAKYETLATIAHSQHLMSEFGTHAHTVSIPRLRPAGGAILDRVPHPITDTKLKQIVAVLRLSLPSAGVVVSTRESAELRSELLHTGATQLSAASRTNPGGYTVGEESLEQFSTNDHRDLKQVLASVMDEGYLPSLCTSCYRVGRTGAEFTRRTTAGEMEKFCQANAILTLKEYLVDHAAENVKANIEKVLTESIDEIKDGSIKKALLLKLSEIDAGARDVFF